MGPNGILSHYDAPEPMKTTLLTSAASVRRKVETWLFRSSALSLQFQKGPECSNQRNQPLPPKGFPCQEDNHHKLRKLNREDCDTQADDLPLTILESALQLFMLPW